MGALKGAGRLTSSAHTARLHERTCDVISDTEQRNIWTDCGHDSGDLVAKYRRGRNEIVSGEQQIGVTQAGCLHVDESFAPNRRGDVYVFEIESAPERVNY
jgi:hypothetical protein